MTVPASKPNPVVLLMAISAGVSAVSALAGFSDYVPNVVAFWIMAGNTFLTVVLAIVARGLVVPETASQARKIEWPDGTTQVVAGSQTYDTATGNKIPAGQPVAVTRSSPPWENAAA